MIIASRTVGIQKMPLREGLRRFSTLFAREVMRRFYGILEPEDSLAEKDGAVCASPSSPRRFEFQMSRMAPIRRRMPSIFGSLPTMRSIMSNIQLSLTSLDQNPERPRALVDGQFLRELENYVKALGVGAVGYAKLPRELIFLGKAVLHDNAIVLVMEMDREKIDMAPSRETAVMIHETYDQLGIAANKLTDFLRKNDHSAQAGHPLGGSVLYPPLAELAGLGWHGRHGLLITPEFGPRVRIAAVYTSITNLPVGKENPHSRIEESCATCGRCIRKCPANAILDSPLMRDKGLKTHINSGRCFRFFAENWGCSVCIKECRFNKEGYYELKNRLSH